MKLIMGLLLLAAFAFGDDHGNSISTATPIGTNSATRGNIEIGKDADFFKVVLPSSGNLEIRTTSDLDMFGWLLDSTGGIITYDDDSGSNRNFRIVRNNIAAGTYYIKVRHYSTNGGGHYILRVHFTPGVTPSSQDDDYGNSLSTATLAEINSVTPGSIEPRGDVDFFKVILPVSGNLKIYTNSNIHTEGYLFDSAGRVISSNNINGSSYNFIIVKNNMAAGTYYIKVGDYSTWRTGHYVLHIEFTAPYYRPVTDHDDDYYNNNTTTYPYTNPNTNTQHGGGQIDTKNLPIEIDTKNLPIW